ncbi:MAG TPA: DUF2939 domain-containing protein [Thermoanaerobaculia bacterium]|nr:DUF2939 domain-containing protein [Thermoanaerobaculia bacterium]
MGKRLALVVIALVLITAAAAYVVWTRSPRYALREAAAAMKDHDLAKFQRYVDSEKLVGRFVDDMLASATAEANKNPFGGLAVGMFMMMRPQLVKSAQEALERAVETGDFDATKAQDGNPADVAKLYWKRSSKDESGYGKIAYIKKQGKIALAGLEIYDADVDQTFVVDFKLRDLGDHWQVTEFANLRQLQEAMQQATKRKLDDLNRPISQQMSRAVKFESIKGSSSSDDWGFSRKSGITVVMRNTSTRDIAEIHFIVTFDVGGEIVGTFPCSYEEVLSPDEQQVGEWSKDANQFIEEDMKLYKNIAVATPSAELRSIKFADGTVLQLLTTLPRKHRRSSDVR